MMRVVRSLGWAAICCVALGACDDLGPPEKMSLSAARANLLHVAGAGSTQAFCSEEGQRDFRRAVRSFSAAAVVENVPPQVNGVLGNDEAWSLIGMGVMARVVQVSDLEGPARDLATLLSFQGAAMPGMGQTRDAMSKACPELIAVYRDAAALARVQAKLEQARQDHEDRHDIQELQEDGQSRAERLQSDLRRLEQRMRAQGWKPEDLRPH